MSERYCSYWNYDVAVYRGDDIIAQGTIKQVAEKLGVLKSTIYFYTTPTGAKRAAKAKNQAKVRRVVLV
jgi:hypothetical protein